MNTVKIHMIVWSFLAAFFFTSCGKKDGRSVGYCELSATWQLVDAFQYAVNQPAIATSITFDEDGYLYSVGYATNSNGKQEGIVRKSINLGTSWLTVDHFSYDAQSNAQLYDISTDGSGNLVAVGFLPSFTGAGGTIGVTATRDLGVVRKSTDKGVTWSNTATVNYAQFYGFAYDSNNNRFITGMSTTDANLTTAKYWTTYKSTDLITWTVVDRIAKYDLATSSATGIHVTNGNIIYTSGYSSDISSKYLHVRKSTDSGSGWQAMGYAQLTDGKDAAVNGITTTGSNDETVYAVGYGTDLNNKIKWIVRRSIDSGVTWEVLDNYEMTDGQGAVANSVAVAGNGDVYVAGYALDNRGVAHWIVKRSVDEGKTWTVVDDYTYEGQARAARIIRDGVGNMFVVGYGSASNGTLKWLVRRLSCKTE